MTTLATSKMNRESSLPLTIIVFFLMSLIQNTDDARAERHRVYRESQGEVAKFTVQVTDPGIRVTSFARLQDGTVIRPYLYYYQVRRTTFGGVGRIEKIGRTFRSLSRNKHAQYNVIRLPQSKEIAAHLLLVRRSFHKDSVPDYVSETKPYKKMSGEKTDYVWANWQLLELPTGDISPDKPIEFPSFEVLSNRELSKEKEELLKDLVQMYDKIAAVARKKARTPVPSHKIKAGQNKNPQSAHEEKVEQEKESEFLDPPKAHYETAEDSPQP